MNYKGSEEIQRIIDKIKELYDRGKVHTQNFKSSRDKINKLKEEIEY